MARDGRARMTLAGLNGGLLLLGLLLVVAEVVFLASRPEWRIRADATKTRAYSLSEQSRRLLDGLEGEWSITLVVDPRAVDGAMLRQVDEVLRRFTAQNASVRTTRLDPTAPQDMARWEALLDSVQQAFAPEARAFDEALDEALAAFEDLRRFAVEEATALGAFTAPTGAANDPALTQLGAALGQFAEQAGTLERAIADLRTTTPARPIADAEGARSALVANHAHWSEQLNAAAGLLERWAADASIPEPIRRHATLRRPAYEALALRLRREQDRLAQLPPLELSEIGRQLATGEAAVVVGPRGVAVVPSWQLLPSVDARASGSGVSFDRRFRGEQMLAGAIRSLLEPMPLCVFLHGEPRSILSPREDRLDMSAAADALRAARYGVTEWTLSAANPPQPQHGERVVWIVVPPLQRSGIETTAAERRLLERATALIAEGEPVMLTVARSLLPGYRQADPWATLAEPFGLSVDTGAVVFEWDRVTPDSGTVRPWQPISRYEPGHVMSDALQGLALVLTHPMSITIDEESGAAARAIAVIEPSASRWLERDWRNDGRDVTAPPADGAFERDVIAVAGGERRGEGGRTQRLLLIASGGWHLTAVMDVMESLGGERVLLTNPGNRELLLSGVAWLAGLDDWIAPGPTGREVARLEGVTPRARVAWFVMTVAALPLLVLGLGAIVAIRRRRP